MSNMSYCRFRNTLADLEDCQEALEMEDEFEEMDEDEEAAMKRLIRLCGKIHEEFGHLAGDEEEED